MLISNRSFLLQLYDIIVLIVPNLVRMYKTVSNTQCLNLVKISYETKNIFILIADFERIVSMAAI